MFYNPYATSVTRLQPLKPNILLSTTNNKIRCDEDVDRVPPSSKLLDQKDHDGTNCVTCPCVIGVAICREICDKDVLSLSIETAIVAI